jgi:hypothetical protein
MAEGRRRDQWNHTASVLALVANANRDPKKGRAFTPADFHPMSGPKREPPPIKADISVLKVFVNGGAT